MGNGDVVRCPDDTGGPVIRRTLIAVLTVVVLVVALWYAVWPPRTDSGYRHQAVQTVGKFRSQVATAQLWGRELDRDHAFLRTVRVGLSEMESDATGTLDQFSAYQPPSGEESMRSDVTALGDTVVTRLGDLRIAARDGDTQAVVEKARGLDDLLHRIDQVEKEVRR